jgi:hypothetical protein
MKKEINPITKSVDTLWTITILYAFYQITELRGYWPILIGVLTTLLLINEWFSVRATFDFYSDSMFVADVFDVFLYVLAYSALKRGGELTYSPIYWLCLALIWFVYFAWDVSVLPFTKDKESTLSLRKWMYSMLATSIFTFGSFLFLLWIERNQLRSQYEVVIQVLQYANLVIIVIVLYSWNKKKLETVRNALRTASSKGKLK